VSTNAPIIGDRMRLPPDADGTVLRGRVSSLTRRSPVTAMAEAFVVGVGLGVLTYPYYQGLVPPPPGANFSQKWAHRDRIQLYSFPTHQCQRRSRTV
jgi:hypothetical protein